VPHRAVVPHRYPTSGAHHGWAASHLPWISPCHTQSDPSRTPAALAAADHFPAMHPARELDQPGNEQVRAAQSRGVAMSCGCSRHDKLVCALSGLWPAGSAATRLMSRAPHSPTYVSCSCLPLACCTARPLRASCGDVEAIAALLKNPSLQLLAPGSSCTMRTSRGLAAARLGPGSGALSC